MVHVTTVAARGLPAIIGGIAGIVAAVEICVVEDPVGGIAVPLAVKSDCIIVSDPRIRCGKIRRSGRQEPPARTRRIVQVFHLVADIVVLVPRSAVARCAGPDPLIIGAVDVRVVHVRVRVLVRAGDAADRARAVVGSCAVVAGRARRLARRHRRRRRRRPICRRRRLARRHRRRRRRRDFRRRRARSRRAAGVAALAAPRVPVKRATSGVAAVSSRRSAPAVVAALVSAGAGASAAPVNVAVLVVQFLVDTTVPHHPPPSVRSREERHPIRVRARHANRGRTLPGRAEFIVKA